MKSINKTKPVHTVKSAQPSFEVLAKGERLDISTGTGFQILEGRPGMEVVELSAKRPVPTRVKGQLHTRRLAEGAVEMWQTYENHSGKAVGITKIELFEGRIEAGEPGWLAMHQELCKSDRFFGGYECLNHGTLMAPLNTLEGEFGLSEDSPFPGFGFSHPDKGAVLLAVLTQDRSKPVWSFHRKGKRHVARAAERFWGVPHIEVESGAVFESEHWVAIFSPAGMEDALDRYFGLLRKRVRFVGETSVARRAVIWGSWNYNPRPRGKGDIEHDYVVANARALKKLAPNRPRYVIVDDGYQPGRSGERGGTGQWQASAFEYFFDPEKPAWDPKLFPKGMKALMDDITAAGCEPALWITPRIRSSSELAKRRPGWLVRMEEGRRFQHPFRFLDYSVPEVREYVCQVWDTVFNQWGIKAVKLDFWTYGFEIPGIRYRHGGRTAIELRNQFLADLRGFLPKDGFILTCCTMNSGNPFVGRYVDAARNGWDIGFGTWELLREAAAWQTNISPFYRHDCLLPHADSIGWSPQNTVGENRLWATVALMNTSVLEFGGDLTSLSPEGKTLMKKAIEFAKPAKRSRNAALSHVPGPCPVDHAVLEREDGVYEAYFNWRMIQREVFLERSVRDLWTGKRLHGRVLVPPHDVIWFKRPE